MANSETTKPLYPRITEWADHTAGEFLFCWTCAETRAICPDCGFEVCVFCDDECEGCHTSVF